MNKRLFVPAGIAALGLIGPSLLPSWNKAFVEADQRWWAASNLLDTLKQEYDKASGFTEKREALLALDRAREALDRATVERDQLAAQKVSGLPFSMMDEVRTGIRFVSVALAAIVYFAWARKGR